MVKRQDVTFTCLLLIEMTVIGNGLNIVLSEFESELLNLITWPEHSAPFPCKILLCIRNSGTEVSDFEGYFSPLRRVLIGDLGPILADY